MKLNAVLLAVSVVANVVLAALLVVGKPSPSSGPAAPKAVEAPTAVASNQGPDVALGSAADAGAKEYHDSLLKKDLSAKERATLLVAHLNREYEQQLSASSAYWLERKTAALAIASADQARSDVLAIVGESAWSEPALASIFQPFRREYPSLDPRKQVEVQRLIQRYFQAHETVQADPMSYRQVVERSYQDLRKGVAAVLTPSEYSEYVVRLSPLADAIRRMKLELNESQFRQLLTTIDADEHFSRLALRLEGQRTSLSLYDPKLATLLGKEQHLAFISRIDPVYGALASLARSQAVPAEKLSAVYAAFVQQQGGGGASDPAELARSTFGPGAEFILKQFVHQAART